MPEPRPKAIMSTRPVGTPTQDAMVRFWVTPRTNSPRRVRVSISHTSSTTVIEKPMITMRFHGSTRFTTVIPPLIQVGFETSTFWAPNNCRTNWIRNRLMPQVASSVSSGRP